MKEKACLILLLLGAALPLSGGMKVMSFEEVVIEIEQFVVDLTAPSDLLDSPAFMAVREDALRWKREALKLVASTKASDQQKMIVVLAMQSLPKEQYPSFLASVSDLFVDKKCSERVLSVAIAPGTEWSVSVLECYRNQMIVASLEAARDAEHASANIRRLIARVLSGEALANVRRLQ